MKTIGHVFSHNSLQTQKKESNKDVRASKPLQVSTYRKLVQLVAQIAYCNRDIELFFRGQNREFCNSKGQSSIQPSIYRKSTVDMFAFDRLLRCANALAEKEFRFEHDDTFSKFDQVKLAILQHYEVCETPLLDLTASLRVACSFALEQADQTGILYIIGLPRPNGSISFYVEEELINVKLLGICPPQALRPHFQDGFLVGTFPEPQQQEFSRRGFDVEKLDFGRRLVAKFELIKDGFWDHAFTPIPHDALFPDDDVVDNVCQRMKSSMF